MGPVSARVPLYSRTNIIRAASQNQQVRDCNNVFHVPGLSGVARQAVEDDQITFLPTPDCEEASEDLFSKGEVFVFEKTAISKNITDKPLFIQTEFRGRLLNRCDIPEFLAKIEMMASPAQDASLLHMFSQRGLTRARRSDQKDRLNGFQPVSPLIRYNPGNAGGQGKCSEKLIAAIPWPTLLIPLQPVVAKAGWLRHPNGFSCPCERQDV